MQWGVGMVNLLLAGYFYRENYRDIIPGGEKVWLLPHLLRVMVLPCAM